MQLIAIDTLTHQQQALESEPEPRIAAYERLVNQPLQPFMDTIRKRMPQGQDDYDMTHRWDYFARPIIRRRRSRLCLVWNKRVPGADARKP